MNADEALRYLAHEAQRCRGRDQCEIFCLLFPAFLKVYDLPPMDGADALEFRHRFNQVLRQITSEVPA